MLAEGGVIPATRGGQLFIGGEAGQAEAVIPLDRLGDMLNGRQAKGQGVHVDNLNMYELSDPITTARATVRRLATLGET